MLLRTFLTNVYDATAKAGKQLIVNASGTVLFSAANPGKVDVQSALPAGTNAIGKLAANSGVDIGDVDVLSLPALPAGTNNIGDVDVLTMPDGSGAVTMTHSAPSVGSSTGSVLAANANRLFVLLQNDSDTVIYVKFGVDAALNAGIRLAANGGLHEFSKKLGNLDTRQINAICSATGKVLLVTEG